MRVKRHGAGRFLKFFFAFSVQNGSICPPIANPTKPGVPSSIQTFIASPKASGRRTKEHEEEQATPGIDMVNPFIMDYMPINGTEFIGCVEKMLQIFTKRLQ